MTTFRQEIDRLRKDYPAFVIVPTRVCHGERVAAYCPDAAQDGLYAVIGTPGEVEAELAKAFAGHEARLRTIAPDGYAGLNLLIGQLILWSCRKKSLNEGPLPSRR
jgi:hypothetical protein